MAAPVRFTKRSVQIMEQSIIEAKQRGSRIIYIEHLLIALVKEAAGPAAQVFQQLQLDPQATVSVIEKVCAPFSHPATVLEEPQISPGVHKMLFLARREAQRAHHQEVGTEYLLLGLMGVDDRVMHKILAELNISPQSIRQVLHEQFPEIPLKPSGWVVVKYRLIDEFYNNFGFYVPQSIRKLFKRFLDSSKPPPLG